MSVDGLGRVLFVQSSNTLQGDRTKIRRIETDGTITTRTARQSTTTSPASKALPTALSSSWSTYSTPSPDRSIRASKLSVSHPMAPCRSSRERASPERASPGRTATVDPHCLLSSGPSLPIVIDVLTDGSVLVRDGFRIRRFTVGGTISTITGGGVLPTKSEHAARRHRRSGSSRSPLPSWNCPAHQGWRWMAAALT